MRRSGLLAALAGVVLAGATLLGCAGEAAKPAPTTARPTTASQPATATTPAPSDYSKARNWLSAPETTDKPVDVFYLYPTSYRKFREDSANICGIGNVAMRTFAKTAYARQASAFEPAANVFAPYYRQADAGYTLALPQAEQDAVIGGIPATDATAAFEYYLEHYNEGRPFILAGHSQGSNVLLFLLSGYLKDHPEVYERMVAAYVVGYSVTPEFLDANPHLKFAEGRIDTGVIVSWNTEAPEIGGPSPVVHAGSLAINPITWSRDETTATASANLGSIELQKTGAPVKKPDGSLKILKDFADARVDLKRGVVVCSTAPVDKLAPGNDVFPRGVFHSFDYPFYYLDIRQNAADRITAFLKQ